MPEGPVTEVFRADLDVNLRAKEALAELDQLNNQIKKAVGEMQAAFDSLQFKSPFKTWQSEIQMVGRELAALTMPKAMRFDLPERELERYAGRIKDIAREYGVTFKEIETYLQQNAEAMTKYGRAGAEAFIKSMQDLKARVVSGSIIPEMVAEIRNALMGLAGQLGAGAYGPFAAIARWASNVNQDTKMQFVGLAAGIVESFANMATQVQAPIAATAAQADEMLFGLQGRWKGLIPTIYDVVQAFRLIREEGGNIGVGLSLVSGAVGGLIERFGGSSDAAQRFLNITDKAREIFGAAGGAITNFRRQLQGHDIVLDQVARSTSALTEQLKMQAGVWRRTSSEAIGAAGELGPYMQEVVSRITGNVGQLDTALRHVTTTFLATGKISAERMQDARDAVRDLTAAMEAARKLGIPLDPKFEARMKEAFGAVRTLAAEEQRLAAGREKRAEIQKRATQAAKEANTQTRQMISYLRPGGPMSAGLSSTNMMLRSAGAGMQRFSLSVGSALSVVAGIGGVLGQLDPAFATVIVGAAQMADRFLASITAMQAAAMTGKERIRMALTAIGAALTGFGIAAMGVIVSTGKLAADIETLWITLETTAKNVGIPIDAIKEKLDALKDSGITTRNSMNSLIQFLRAKLPLDQLDELADAAKNVAVTLPQMTSSEVMQRFVWIIQTGNSALLNAIGIQKTVNQMVEEYADKMGLASKALTIRQKQEAIMMGLIGEVSSFQGVYNEAMKTAGKQLGSMVRYWEELRLKIGEQFLPIVTEVVAGFTNFLKKLNEMRPAQLRLITMIVAVTAVFGTLLGVLLLLAPGIASLTGLIGGLIGVIGSIVTAVGGFVVATLTSVAGLTAFASTVLFTLPILGGLLAIIIKLIKGFQDIEVEGEGVEAFVNRLKVAFKPLIDTWRYFWNEVVMARWPRIQQGIQNIIDSVKQFGTEHKATFDFMEAAWVVAKDLIYTIVEVVDQILAALGDLMNYDYDAAWEHFRTAAEWAVAWVSELFQDFILAAYDWGVNAASQLALGLIDAAKTAIPTAAEYVGGMLSLFLEGRSPPIKGPLKRVREWGRGVGTAFGAGVGDVSVTAHMMTIGEQFSALRGKAKDWGRNMVGTFAEGISGKAAAAIAPAMEVVGTEISRFLAGRSPPEMGQLAELQDWGKSAMEAFMEGFTMADFGVFDSALSMIETRMKMVVGTGKEQGAELAAAMLDMRDVVAEAIATMGAGVAVDVSNLANTLFESVAVPVIDILQVAQATLEAQAAADAVKAIQDEAEAAKDARQAGIEAVQETIHWFQEEIEGLEESRDDLEAALEEEVLARQEIAELVIDPAVLDRLEAELRAATIKAEEQAAELQKLTAYRERLGIDMLSWEEVSLMASLDLANQKQAEAQIAVDKEQDRIDQAEALEEAVEAEYDAQFDAIEARIEQIQDSIENEQDLLYELQKADKAATKAEQDRIAAAREHAAALAEDAALLKKALEERIKAEELAAKAAEAIAEAIEEGLEDTAEQVRSRIGGVLEGAGWEPTEEAIEPAPSDQLRDRLNELRELLEAGPAAIAGALALAVYEIAKPILAEFGIDLDGVIAGAQQKWTDVKDFFSGVKETWEEAIGKAKKAVEPLVEAVEGLYEKLVEAFEDPDLREAWEDLKEAWEDLKEALEPLVDALEELWEDQLEPLLEQLVEIIDKSEILDKLLRPFVAAILLPLIAAFAGLVGIIEGVTKALDGIIIAAEGILETLTGVMNLITGLLSGDKEKIERGWEDIVDGIEGIILGFTLTVGGFFVGFAEGILNAMGLDSIVEAFETWKNDIAAKFTSLVTDATTWGSNLVSNLRAGIETNKPLLDEKINAIKAKISEIGNEIWLNATTWGSNLVNNIRAGIETNKPLLDEKINTIKNKIGEIGSYITTNAWSWGSNLVSKMREGITAGWEAFTLKVGEIKNKISEIGSLVGGYMGTAWYWGYDLLKNIKDGIVYMWTTFTGKIDDVIGKIQDIWDDAMDQGWTWGYNFIMDIRDGINYAYETYLVGAVQAVIDWLKRVLGFESAPAEGPLSGAGEWGPNMMKLLASGIRDFSPLVYDEINKLAAGLSAGITIPMAMGGAGAPLTIQYAPVLNFYGPVSPEEVKQAVAEAPEEIDWRGMARR